MGSPPFTAITNRSPAEEKIALFGALFRGREDVYPRRFESAATGRKDALLQENGYLVLRFLAEDVSERLTDVLEGLLRAVRHQRSRRQA